jgi:hypothetical protein
VSFLRACLLGGLGSLVLAPAVALAQAPGEPALPPDGAGSAASPTTATVGDDAHIKELVDREVARILNERAAKEAADKANEAEAPAAQAQPGNVVGQSGFFDTRIAFTLTNENVLVSPGETIPSVPGWRFGVPTTLGTLFFDNYDTRYSGFETLSHIVSYRDFHSGHIDAESALVVRINELSGTNIQLTDDGSYLAISDWKDPSHKDPTRVTLVAFPVSADRFRLGYSYRLSWGGDPEYSRASSATPGVKLQYDTDGMYAFVGAKSAVILNQATAEQESALAALGGAGVDIGKMLRIEVNGGYFDRGFNQLIDVEDQKVRLYGASGQISLHDGMPLRSSVDYRLYKFNGEQVSNLFAPESYPGGFSWLAQSEFTVLGQTLKDPDKTGATRVQTGMAGDINFRAKLDRFRFQADVSYRDLAFILHSVPSLPTYEDFPDGPTGYKTTADLFADVGVTRNWADLLTLGLTAGIEKPATLTSPVGIPGGATGVAGNSTAVIRNDNVNTVITILPTGESVVPQVALKGSARIDFGRMYVALFEVYYSHDGNVTTYQRVGCAAGQACPDNPFEYVFTQPNQLGVNATIQARF